MWARLPAIVAVLALSAPATPSPLGALGKLGRVIAHPAAPRRQLIELGRLARDRRHARLEWKKDQPLAEARNAHLTATPRQLRAALTKDYNFLEGDVYLEGLARHLPIVDRAWHRGRGRQAVMGHLGDADGLTFREWLSVAAPSGRALKLDIKQAAALPEILAALRAEQVPGWRLVFNGDVVTGRGGPGRLKWGLANLALDRTLGLADLQRIRRLYPDATIALGVATDAHPKGPPRHDERELETLIRMARRVGGPITFPMRAEYADGRLIARLKPYGKISVWNNPATYRPADIDLATRRLRAMGVDGMIDLRQGTEP